MFFASLLLLTTPSTICIDPGHSKATVGAHGKHLLEYKVCWQVAQKLKGELEQQGYRVVVTKNNEDENVPNERRAEVANAAHASLFLRLHCDAGSGSGIATYYPDRQGVFKGVRGPAADIMRQSHNAAIRFQPALVKALNGELPDKGVKGDSQTNVGGKQGALTGSIFARVPVLLVEMCVLTNPHDERLLGSAFGQRHMAHALAAGVGAVVNP